MHTNSVRTTMDSASAGIVGDTYVANLEVIMHGDAPRDSMTVAGNVFEELMVLLQMRQLAFEPRTRAFRPHSVKALMVRQRLGRVWPAITAADDDHPGLLSCAEQLREILEMSDNVSWKVA